MNKLITILFTFICLAFCDLNYFQTKSNDLLRQKIVGEWELLKDKKFKVIYTKDKITYIYNGKIKYTNPIVFVFSDDSKKFSLKGNSYNFTTNEIQNDNFKIVEYNIKNSDTLTSYILYVDNESLEISSESKDVTFKKIKSKRKK